MKVATVHGVPNISERNSMNSKKSDKLEEFPKENTSLRMTAVTLLGRFSRYTPPRPLHMLLMGSKFQKFLHVSDTVQGYASMHK